MLNYNSNTPDEVRDVDHGSVAGIRFYEGIQPTDEDTILAAGVHESAYDVRGQYPYLRSNGNNIDGYATRLSLTIAQSYYLKYKQNSEMKYRVYASRTAINNILAKPDVLGIRFYSVDISIEEKAYRTFMMVGVYKKANGELVDRNGDNEYVLLDRPCPPDCSDNSNKGLISMKKGIDF